MQALFKARFEQALDSQKLNIKKIEQQLRRKGVNPEDPIAMASIQRVASTFFRAIDEKQGTPYVFRGDRQSTAATDDLQEPANDDYLATELSPEDSDQEELDRFIAEIEDAADQEWAAEEAAEREEASKIRYWGKEESGMTRGRNPNWSASFEDGHRRTHGDNQRTMNIRKWDSRDDISEASEGEEGGQEVEYSGDELDEEDVRVKLASTRPRKDEMTKIGNSDRFSEANGSGSDSELFGSSEGDEFWESEDEKDHKRNAFKPEAASDRHHGPSLHGNSNRNRGGSEFDDEFGNNIQNRGASEFSDEFGNNSRSRGRTAQRSNKKDIDESWDSD